jgi:hypothetical protein
MFSPSLSLYLTTITTLHELHYHRIPHYAQFSVLYLTSYVYMFDQLCFLIKKKTLHDFHQWVNALLHPKEIKIPRMYGAVCHLICLVKLELHLCLDIYKVSFFMIVSLRLGSRTISSAICGDGKLEYIF